MRSRAPPRETLRAIVAAQEVAMRIRYRNPPWPRVYAQLVATREVFEIARGLGASNERLALMFSRDFGPAWVVWSEARGKGIGARGAAPVEVAA